MKFEPPSFRISEPGNREARFEAAQHPMLREDLLAMLEERQRFVADRLAQLEHAPTTSGVKANLRKYSELNDAISSAINKYSRPSKEELRNPAIAGQVWISDDFKKRLDTLGEEQGRDAIAFLREQESARNTDETEATGKRRKKVNKLFPELTGAELARWNEQNQEKQSARMKTAFESEEKIDVPRVSDEIRLGEADLTPETSDEAYVRKLGERIQTADEPVELAGEETRVDIQNQEDLSDLNAASEGELEVESGIRKVGERSLEARRDEALQALELWAEDAMDRYRTLKVDLEKPTKELEFMRQMDVLYPDPKWNKYNASLETYVTELGSHLGEAWQDILMIEKQIAAMRAEMVDEAPTKPISLVEAPTIPDIMVTPVKSRRRNNKRR